MAVDTARLRELLGKSNGSQWDWWYGIRVIAALPALLDELDAARALSKECESMIKETEN